MKLISAHVEGFGKLEDMQLELNQGVNRIIKENGWGKTTFAAFLFVMLYGMENKNAKGIREKYAPWFSEKYGGSLLIETKERRYLIERTFGRYDENEDTYSITDYETREPVSEYDEFIGDELFKVNSESFLRTAFVFHNDCITFADEGVRTRINEVSSETFELRTCGYADKLIDEALHDNSPDERDGEIYKLKTELAELFTKIRFIDGLREGIVETDAEIKKLKDKKRNILLKADEEAAPARTEAGRSDKNTDEQRLYTENYIELKNKLRSAELRMREKASPAAALDFVCSGLGLVFIGGAFVFNFIGIELIPLIIAAFGLIVFVVFFILGLKNVICFRREIREARAEYEQIREEYDYFAAKKNETKLVTRIASKDSDSGYMEDLEGIDYRLDELTEKREFMYSQLDDAEDAELRAEEIQAAIDGLSVQNELLKKTSDYLGLAGSAFSGRLLEPLNNAFVKYFAMFTKDEETHCQLDSNLSPYFDFGGVKKGEGVFSTGQRDIIGLAFRFALLDTMYPEEKPFVVMDDPFMNLDSLYRQSVLNSLYSMKYQILIFEKN